MSDEVLLQAEVNRAARARALADDPMLAEAFETLEQSYVAAWKGTAARDGEARERFWLAVQIVGKLRRHLSEAMASGTVAQKELDELAGRRGRCSGDNRRMRVRRIRAPDAASLKPPEQDKSR